MGSAGGGVLQGGGQGRAMKIGGDVGGALAAAPATRRRTTAGESGWRARDRLAGIEAVEIVDAEPAPRPGGQYTLLTVNDARDLAGRARPPGATPFQAAEEPPPRHQPRAPPAAGPA